VINADPSSGMGYSSNPSKRVFASAPHRSMPSIKFRTRLSLAFATLVALVCIQAGFIYLGSERVTFAKQHSRLASDILSDLLELSTNKQRLRVWASQRLMNGDAPIEARDRWLAGMRTSAASLRDLTQRDLAWWTQASSARGTPVPEAATQLAASIDLLDANIAEVQARLLRLEPLEEGAEFSSVWQQLNQVFDVTRGRDLRELVNGAIARQREAVPVARKATERAVEVLRLQAIGLAVLTLVAAVLIAIRLNRRLQAPIAGLLAGTQALQAGRMDHRLEVGSRDEFGQVAEHFNAMAAELQQRRSDAEAARHKLEAAVDARTAELQSAHVTLQNIDQRRRQLFADLSHELRTPATAIRGEAEIALRGADKPPAEYKLTLSRIVGGVEQLARVIDDLMLIARAEADQLVIRQDRVDLGLLVGDAAEQAEALGALHGVGVRLDAPYDAQPALVQVHADADRLRQALMIVLDNAVRYSRAGGAVRIGWRELDGCVEIAVRDQGIGIDADEMPTVFQRFTRGQRARAHRVDGTGIGLSIAQVIVSAHEGRIDIESEPFVGTTVRIRLPRFDGTDFPTAPEAA
jgi:signal transduction histidine kinase